MTSVLARALLCILLLDVCECVHATCLEIDRLATGDPPTFLTVCEDRFEGVSYRYHSDVYGEESYQFFSLREGGDLLFCRTHGEATTDCSLTTGRLPQLDGEAIRVADLEEIDVQELYGEALLFRFPPNDAGAGASDCLGVISDEPRLFFGLDRSNPAAFGECLLRVERFLSTEPRLLLRLKARAR